MGRLGFFDVLSNKDLSWQEAEAINRAGDRADAALLQGTMLGESIGKLQQRVQAQQQEIAQLRIALAVLARVLEDAGTVDAKVLDYRIEAALEEAEAAAVEKGGKDTQMCVACSLDFPRSVLNITETGAMCDSCLAGD